MSRRDVAKLDPDLEERVSSTTRTPVRAAVVGFAGVLLIVGIDLLSGGKPSLVQTAAIALAIAVVDATVLGGALALRRQTRRWARVEQLRREDAVPLPPSASARMIVAEEVEDDRR